MKRGLVFDELFSGPYMYLLKMTNGPFEGRFRVEGDMCRSH